MYLFKTKLPEIGAAPPLRRSLNVFDLTLLGIGGMIGGSVSMLTGTVAATQTGPGVIVSYFFAGVTAGLVGLAYAELAARIGGCGGAYGYAYALFGELMAWVVGWNLVFGIGVTVAAFATAWSDYLAMGVASLGMQLDHSLLKGPAEGGLINLPAAAIIILLMLMLCAGTKLSAWLNNLAVIFKVLTLIIFIVIVAGYFRRDFLDPKFPFGWLSFTPDGNRAGVLAGAAVLFFAYIGLPAIAGAVEEAKNPQRDIPIAMALSIIISSVLYVIIGALLTGTVAYPALNDSSPLVFVLLRLGANNGAALVTIGLIVGLIAAMLGLYYALTRTLFAIARDRQLPSALTRLGGAQVPVSATMLSGIVLAVIAGFVPLEALARFANVSILADFAFVCCALIALRLTAPDVDMYMDASLAPFVVPGGMAVAALGGISSVGLIALLPFDAIMGFGLWLLAGLAIGLVLTAGRKRNRPA